MKNKKFISEVLKLEPLFINSGSYFFYKNVEFILSGFCFEKTPRGAYVWSFFLPLFDSVFHLSYGMRLSGSDGYMDFELIPEDSLPKEFLTRISHHTRDEQKQSLSLEGFKELLLNRDPKLIDLLLLADLSFTLILLNDFQKAQEYLDIVVSQAKDDSHLPYYIKSKEVLCILKADSELAKNKVVQWVNENKLLIIK